MFVLLLTGVVGQSLVCCVMLTGVVGQCLEFVLLLTGVVGQSLCLCYCSPV